MRGAHTPEVKLALNSVVAVGCALVLAGCGGNGGGESIPTQSADRLLSGIELVDNLSRDGRCEEASNAAEALREQARSLPAGVDAELKSAIDQGIGRLQSLLDKDSRCRNKPKPAPVPEPAQSPPPQRGGDKKRKKEEKEREKERKEEEKERKEKQKEREEEAKKEEQTEDEAAEAEAPADGTSTQPTTTTEGSAARPATQPHLDG